MSQYQYEKANKYPDLADIYENCGGPGGLKLSEFLANKMGIREGSKLLDIGTNKGYQTCFLAKEYKPFIVGIDPWSDAIQVLMKNAEKWGVEGNVIGLKAGVPNTPFADACFDYVYSTTTLEMIRGMKGEEGYKACLEEIYRVLKPGGVFGLGEPMHNDVDIPEVIKPYVTKGDMPAPWTECFATLEKTIESIKSAGFEIIEAGKAPDAQLWWEEFTKYDAYAGEDAFVIQHDKGRWTTYGYIIARKNR